MAKLHFSRTKLLWTLAPSLKCSVFFLGGGEGAGARNRYHLSVWFFFSSFMALFDPIWGAIHLARPVVGVATFSLF